MKRIVFAVGLWAAALPASAQDLLDIYRQAQQNDPQWAAARLDHAANLERRIQGRSLLLPRVALSGSVLRVDQQVDMPQGDIDDTYQSDSYGVQLTQPLYRKQNFAGYRQGEAAARQAEADLAAARQDLILRVAGAYFSVLNAQDVLDYARAEKSAIERLSALVQRNFSVGGASLVDVHEARAAYDRVVAQEIAAANDYEIRREALRVLTGEAPEALARLSGKLDLTPPTPADIAQWAQKSRHHPRIASQEWIVESARQELEKARAGRHPNIDLVAGRSRTDAGGGPQGIPTDTTTTQVGVTVEFLLYQGGATSSRIREAAARYEQAQQQLEAVQRQIAQQTREQYLAVLNGLARVRALQQAELSSQRALESTLLGYERGKRTNIDVINAQRERFRASRDLAQARYDYLLSRLRLNASVGELEEKDLEDINRLLAGG